MWTAKWIIYKRKKKKQASILGSISSNVLYKKASTMYCIKGEVIMSFYWFLCSDIGTILTRWRKAKKIPLAGVTEGLEKEKKMTHHKNSHFFFPQKQRIWKKQDRSKIRCYGLNYCVLLTSQRGTFCVLSTCYPPGTWREKHLEA